MNKKILMVLCIFLLCFFYKNLHPKVTYFYYNEGKRTSITLIRSDGSKEYLRPFFTNNVTFYFPFDWSSEPDGIILISKHDTAIFLKEDITFCTMEIYLDENQKISDVKQYDGLCINP